MFKFMECDPGSLLSTTHQHVWNACASLQYHKVLETLK